MLRLADRILLSKGLNWGFPLSYGSPWFKRLGVEAESLFKGLVSNTCKIIIVDNIREFIGVEKVRYNLCQGNGTPPFKTCFIEWIEPDGTQVGLYLEVLPAGVNIETIQKTYGNLKITSAISCTTFYRYKNNICHAGRYTLVYLDAEGSILGIDVVPVPGVELVDYGTEGVMAAYTLAFMNCKNVIIQDDTQEYAQPAKWYRRTKVPQVTYHTINIQPRTIRRNPNPISTGIQQRLHICRGHFMHYKEDGPGMFGRGVYGRFWVPQHPRGSQELGTINARYNVSPPKINLTNPDSVV